MDYLFFIIYGIVLTEWILSKPSATRNTTMIRGYSYYKVSGLLNTIVGMIGLFLIDAFLRDKNIIPVWSVWVGILGCMLFVLMGTYHLYRAMTTLRP